MFARRELYKGRILKDDQIYEIYQIHTQDYERYG
jgi:hypothetical protein